MRHWQHGAQTQRSNLRLHAPQAAIYLLTRGSNSPVASRQKQPLFMQHRLKLPSRSTRAQVVSTKALLEQYRVANQARALLDSRRRWVASPTFARAFESSGGSRIRRTVAWSASFYAIVRPCTPNGLSGVCTNWGSLGQASIADRVVRMPHNE